VSYWGATVSGVLNAGRPSGELGACQLLRLTDRIFFGNRAADVEVNKFIRCSLHYLNSSEREVHGFDEISHDLVPDRMPLFELMALIREAIECELTCHIPCPPSQEGEVGATGQRFSDRGFLQQLCTRDDSKDTVKQLQQWGLEEKNPRPELHRPWLSELLEEINSEPWIWLAGSSDTARTKIFIRRIFCYFILPFRYRSNHSIVRWIASIWFFRLANPWPSLA
jgi:hypothetical protein